MEGHKISTVKLIINVPDAVQENGRPKTG